jgi:mRNA interferase MazF
MDKIKPGDVIIAPIQGANNAKPRPGVGLSSQTYHQTRPDTIIGVVTTNTASANAPSDCLLSDWGAAGLTQPSAFRAFLVTLPGQNYRVIGHLSERDWKAAKTAVASALGMKL